MSTSKRRIVAAGLSVAASLAVVMGVGAVTQEPASGDASSVGRAPADQEGFLLLTDGRMIRGVISRQGTLYVVRQKLGIMRFPGKLVEGAFASIRDAYRHKEERLPEDDPGERVKLARWCLNFHLTAEATEQLVKVLAISPDHGPAQAMLANLENSEKRQANLVDPEVRQTAAEEVAEDRARATDEAVLRGAGRGMGVTGMPVIFNLPQPMAIQRATEFAQFIQPVLQVKCARCHNEAYAGIFQLVPIATPRQRTPDALRANLDATLRLVDPENPDKSELLSSTLRPHGQGPRKQPIFTGSNDRGYQILATWVNKLRPPQYLNTASGTGTPSGPEPAETFGSARGRLTGSSLDATVSGTRAGRGGGSPMSAPAAEPKPIPAYRYRPGQGMVSEDLLQTDPKEFPLPYVLGGPKPTGSDKVDQTLDILRAAEKMGTARPGTAVKSAPRQRNAADPAPTGDGASTVPALSATRRQPASGAADTMSAGTSDSEIARTKGGSGEAKKSKKPLKIDPAILENLLRRNAERAPKPDL